MFPYILLVITIGIIGGVPIYLFFIAEWQVHIDMTKRNSDKYGYGNFDLFKREFVKYNWESKRWKDSLFDYNTNSQYHAGIIQFVGIGMIMRNPIDWIKVKRYVAQHIKETNLKINELYIWE